MGKFKIYLFVLFTCLMGVVKSEEISNLSENNSVVVSKKNGEKDIENVILGKNVVHIKNENVEKENPESALVGKFAVSGNAIVFTRSKSLENYGQLIGLLRAKGDRVFDNTLGGAIVTDGQGNGVASTAFSSYTNKKGEVDRQIKKVLNTGLILGKADLTGGEAEIHGSVEGTSSGNGLLVYGLADYGLILGSDGAGGSIEDDSSNDEKSKDNDGVAGASKVKSKYKEKKYKDKHKKERKAKTKDKHKEKKVDKKNKSNKFKINYEELDYGKSNLDGKAGATISGGSTKPNSGIISKDSDTNIPKIDKTDLEGKSARISIGNFNNEGKLFGELNIDTEEGYMRPSSKALDPNVEVEVEEHNQPQWRSILISASGNGLATNTFVTSPTRQNFSTDAVNFATIESIKNSGEIGGESRLVAGDYATLNYVNTFSVANGISLSAYSDNNVGHYTKTELNNLTNNGEIYGKLYQKAGENTGTGNHEYSTAESVGSANGISLFARSSNAKNKLTESHIRSVENNGIIRGELYSEAGKGNGNIYNKSISSGNGIAIYATGGESNKTSLTSIYNRGIIVGRAEIYGGKDLASTYSNKEKKKYDVMIKNIKDNSITTDNIGYTFDDEEVKKGTIIFEEKKRKNGEKIEKKIKEFKEELEETKIDYEKLEKKVRNKKELLEKISNDYLTRLTTGKYLEADRNKKDIEKGIENFKKEIREQERLMESHYNKEAYQKNIERLRKKQRELENEKEALERRDWENINIEKAFLSYDEKITKKEEEIEKIIEKVQEDIEKIDIAIKEKDAEIEKKNIEIKKNLEKLMKKKFAFGETESSVKKKQERLEREKQKKENEKNIKIREKEIKKAEVKKEIKVVETEIEKLKLKDEEVQDFITLAEKREYLEKTIEHLNSLKNRNDKKENPMTKNKNFQDNTIDATVFIEATGNGLSLNQHGARKEDSETIRFFNNEGVISGYTEVYRGQEDKEYQRVSWKTSGAGISIKGKMTETIKNSGIISGNTFALLAQGKEDTSESISNPKYISGFSKVVNYGILAGRVIIGGYEIGEDSKQDYKYFENLFLDREKKIIDREKYKNHGMFIILDKNEEIKEVIVGEEDHFYNDKIILNIEGRKGTYDFKNESEINNKIVNGIGESDGVVSVIGERKINNSIINGFYNAVKLENNSNLKIKDSLVNANGFGNSYAILGSDGVNTLSIDEKTLLNGRVDLKAGNDILYLAPRSLFQEIDLGEGENTLVLDGGTKTKKIGTSLRNVIEKEYNNKYNIRVLNASNLKIDENSILDKESKITGIKKLSIEKDKKLIYNMFDKKNQPFEDLIKNGKNDFSKVELVGEGEFLVEDSSKKYSLAGTGREILGWDLIKEGREVFLETKSISDSRGKLGISKDEFSKMARGKVVKMNDAYTVLENVYKNLYALNLYTTISNLSLYNKTLLEDSNFLKKDKFEATLKVFDEIDKNEGIKNIISGKQSKLKYGLSDNVNIAVNLGTGNQRINNGRKEVKTDVVLIGVETINKNKNLFWTNGYNYSSIKTKNMNKDNSHTIYTSLKYNIPLLDNLVIIPRLTFIYTMLNQNSKNHLIKDETGNKVGKIYLKENNKNYLEKNFRISLLSNKRLRENTFFFELGTEYSIKRDLGATKILQTEKIESEELKNEWEIEQPKNKNSWVFFTGIKYKNENGISVGLNLKKDNRNIKNTSLFIGYIF